MPIVGAAAVVGKTGADFEHAFTQVRKTVNLTGQDLADFRTGLLDLSTSEAGGGKSANELAGIAAIAGQLGIDGTAALLDFTKTVAQLSVTTGISTNEISDGLARVAVLTGTFKTGEITNVGSAITALGNEMAGSEKDIIDIATRSAGALHAMGASAPDILAVASAASAIGVEPEAAGGALSRIFLQIGNAVAGVATQTPEAAKKIQDLNDKIIDLGNSLKAAEARQATFGRNTPTATVQENAAAIDKYKRELGQAQGELSKLNNTASSSDQLEGLAKVTGLSTDAFKALFKQNPVRAFQAIVNGLHQLGQEKGPDAINKALKDLGLDNIRDIQLMLGLTTASDQLEKALNVSNDAFSANTATQDEVAKAMQDTENQFALLTHQLERIAIDAWPAFRAAAADAIGFVRTEVIPRLQELLAAWKGLSPEMQRAILQFGALAAALGPALIILGVVVSLIGALLTPITLVVIAIALLAAAWATNFGDIQGKTKTVIDFVSALFFFLIHTVIPAVGDAFSQLGTFISGTLLPTIGNAFNALGTFLAPVGVVISGLLNMIADMINFVINLWLNLISVMINIGKVIFDTLSGLISPLIPIWQSLATTLGNVMLQLATIVGNVAVTFVKLWLSAVTTVADFFFSTLLPAIQSIGKWISDNIGGKLLALIEFIAGIAASLGITAVGGFDIRSALAQAQAGAGGAIGATAGAAGAATNEIAVTINNPVVPNAAAGDAFAQQVQDAIVTLLVGSEARTVPLPQPASPQPGQPF